MNSEDSEIIVFHLFRHLGEIRRRKGPYQLSKIISLDFDSNEAVFVIGSKHL